MTETTLGMTSPLRSMRTWSPILMSFLLISSSLWRVALEIFTPPTSTGALHGITRKAVIKLAEKLGYSVVERNITPNELFTADEVFLTGTAAEITPAREVNKRVIGDGKVGQVTKRLMQEFDKMVRNPKEGTLIR